MKKYDRLRNTAGIIEELIMRNPILLRGMGAPPMISISLLICANLRSICAIRVPSSSGTRFPSPRAQPGRKKDSIRTQNGLAKDSQRTRFSQPLNDSKTSSTLLKGGPYAPNRWMQ
jgi:hypothetical protein